MNMRLFNKKKRGKEEGKKKKTSCANNVVFKNKKGDSKNCKKQYEN